MDMYQSPYMGLSGITPEELMFLQQANSELSESQQKYFYMSYTGKRKSPQDVLIFTLIGFVGVAGIQRFLLGEIVMGLLYFFTGGFCLIGTIVDLINHKSLALEYNRKMVYESFQMAKMAS
jgi:TM2 domain-containing membrane protein YozV